MNHLAVASASRRNGLGRCFIDAVLDDGRASRASLATVLSDDTQPGLHDFYRTAGFKVLARTERLEVQFAALPMVVGFPQDHPAYRWAVRVLDPRRARC